MFGTVGQSCNGFLDFGRFQYGGLITMALGLLIILVVAYLIFKKNPHFTQGNSDSPVDLLQKRFVNGEISEEEYKSKKEALKR